MKSIKVNKILFAETESKYYYPYQNFYNPLKRACKNLVSFDTRANYFKYGKEVMNKKFLECIEQEKPDFIFTWVRCDEFYLTTLLKIREISPKTKLFLFFGDDDSSFESFSRYYVLFLDYGLIAQKKYVQNYYSDGVKNVFFVMGLDTSFFKPLKLEKKYDVTFIGLPKSHLDDDRYKTIKFLKENGIKIKLFGNGWENYEDLKDIYGGPLEAEKMVEVINQSKINLCLSKTGNNKTHLKGKVFEGGACKTFVLTEYCEDYLEMFEEGKEIIMFKDNRELLEKINYYLNNEEEREKLAEAAYKKIIKNYSLDEDLKKIFKIANKNPTFHKPLPDIKKRVITITKEDLTNFEVLKEKIVDYDCIILGNGKCENLEYREYLQAYSLEKTKKPISCCDYYLYTKSLGDYLRFVPESALSSIDKHDFIDLLDLNQIMVSKDYLLENLSIFQRAFETNRIDFLTIENTAFVSFPLIRINKPIKQSYQIMKQVSEFTFIHKLFSLKLQGKVFKSFFPYALVLEALNGKKFILDAIFETLKRKDKKGKIDSLIK